MVTDDFNPYHEWLGLDSQLKQPDYYQLLGIEQNESNMMQIAAAADRAAARVRSIRPGPRAAEWAKVLDEIATAKNCLSDPSRRAQYDRQLAAIQPGARGGYHRPAPRDKTATPLPTAAQPNALPTSGPMPASTQAPAHPMAAPTPAGPATTPYSPAAQPTNPTAAPQMPYGSATPSAGTPGYAAPVAPGTPYPTQQTPGAPAMPNPGAAPIAGAPTAVPQAYPTASPQAPAAGMASHAAGYVPGGAAPVPGTAAPIGATAATGQYATAPGASPAATNLPTGVPLRATSTAATAAAASAGPGVKTGSERSASRMVRKRADRSKAVPLLAAGLGGAILILAVVLLAVIGGRGDHSRKGAAGKHLPPHRPATRRPITTPRSSARPAKSSRHRPPVSSFVTETRKEPEPEGVQPTERETSPMDPGTETPGEAIELPEPTVVQTPPDSASRPTEPKPSDTSKPSVPGPSPDPITPSPKPKADLPPKIASKPSPQPAVQPSPAEVAALGNALKSARTKLEDSDFDGALAELRKLESLPKLPEHQAKCERLRLLTEYANNFHAALMEAIKHLEAGDDIPTGANATAGVVGVNANQITLRIDGRNRSYPIDNLSPGLAVAIADTWLDQDDPVCLVAKAAYLASLKDARDDRLAKAREWFQEASNRGVEIDDLEKVIDDKYDDLEKDLAP